MVSDFTLYQQCEGRPCSHGVAWFSVSSLVSKGAESSLRATTYPDGVKMYSKCTQSVLKAYSECIQSLLHYVLNYVLNDAFKSGKTNHGEPHSQGLITVAIGPVSAYHPLAGHSIARSTISYPLHLPDRSPVSSLEYLAVHTTPMMAGAAPVADACPMRLRRLSLRLWLLDFQPLTTVKQICDPTTNVRGHPFRSAPLGGNAQTYPAIWTWQQHQSAATCVDLWSLRSMSS